MSARPTSPCPICTRPATPEFRPFCCRRCATVDLGRWLTQGYAIPDTDEATPAPDDPDDA